MFLLIEGKRAKAAAFNKLRQTIERGLPVRENRMVTWRPTTMSMRIFHDGDIWFFSRLTDGVETTKRHWNAFGSYSESGSLSIAVEINLAEGDDSNHIAGFLARDSESGQIYLMHNGRLGGGQKGITRSSFLAWMQSEPQACYSGDGKMRMGMIVASIDNEFTVSNIKRFVKSTIQYRDAVRTGRLIVDDSESDAMIFKDYFKEFWGLKKRRRTSEIEYITRHGEIVDALRKRREARLLHGESIAKNALIDLGVLKDGDLTELYEIKPSCRRESLYSAIGQMEVYDLAGNCKRFLVLPEDETVPSDIARTLKRLHINVMRFRLDKKQVRIVP